MKEKYTDLHLALFAISWDAGAAFGVIDERRRCLSQANIDTIDGALRTIEEYLPKARKALTKLQRKARQ